MQDAIVWDQHRLQSFLSLLLLLPEGEQLRAPVDSVVYSSASPFDALSVLLCAGLGFLVFGLCCRPGLDFGVTPSPRFMTLASSHFSGIPP